jgi:hypothetical protein
MFLVGEQEEVCIQMFLACFLYGSLLVVVSSLMTFAVNALEFDDMTPVKQLAPFQILYQMKSLHVVPLWQCDPNTLYLECHKMGQTAEFLVGHWYSPQFSLMANLKPSIVLFRNIRHRGA